MTDYDIIYHYEILRKRCDNLGIIIECTIKNWTISLDNNKKPIAICNDLDTLEGIIDTVEYFKNKEQNILQTYIKETKNGIHSNKPENIITDNK